MSDDEARKGEIKRKRLRRWGPNRVPIYFLVSPDERNEYKAKCKRRGLSMNRVGGDLIRSFLEDDSGEE